MDMWEGAWAITFAPTPFSWHPYVIAHAPSTEMFQGIRMVYVGSSLRWLGFCLCCTRRISATPTQAKI